MQKELEEQSHIQSAESCTWRSFCSSARNGVGRGRTKKFLSVTRWLCAVGLMEMVILKWLIVPMEAQQCQQPYKGLSSTFSGQLWVSLCAGPATRERCMKRLWGINGNENPSGYGATQKHHLCGLVKHRLEGKLVVPCKNIKGVKVRQENQIFHLKDNFVMNLNIYKLNKSRLNIRSRF